MLMLYRTNRLCELSKGGKKKQQQQKKKKKKKKTTKKKKKKKILYLLLERVTLFLQTQCSLASMVFESCSTISLRFDISAITVDTLDVSNDKLSKMVVWKNSRR